MRRLAFLIGLIVCGCQNEAPPAHRVELRKLAGDLVELVPKPGSPPHCLVFSIAERGVVRQLTMSSDNESLDCPAARPIGGTGFRIPKAEGKVRIYAFFSDQKLKAPSVAQQVNELSAKARPSFGVLDLRLPGKVVSDVLEYTP